MSKTAQRTALLIVAGLAFLVMLFVQKEEPREVAPVPESEPVAQTDAFGIPTDLFQTVDAKIKRNQTFSDLLSGYNISYQTIAEVAEKSRSVFDIRKLQAGKPFRIYFNEDSLQTAHTFVYRQDPINYVVINLQDSVQIYTAQRPSETIERVVNGVISSSLYNTLLDQDVNPALAIELSEVFAWQIDFYRIQKGDHFRVFFEERRVDGEPVGIGNVLSARFNHFSRDYYAFRFEQDSKPDYFDEEGNSLRKAFLMAPVKFSRISSRYTMRRFHPVQKRYKAHLGTDYAAPNGTPIRATGDGVVLNAQYKRNNGNYVKVKHNGTYTTGYLHMSKIAKGIRSGTTVMQGDIIGYVGSTGLATGPHVCYRFWKNNVQVDHLREDFPATEPVQEQYWDAFVALRNQRSVELTAPTDLPLAAAYTLVMK